MKLPAVIVLATVAGTGIGASWVYASDPGQRVRWYYLVWDISEKKGAVRIDLDLDRKIDYELTVNSIVEMAAWGALLNEHSAYIRSKDGHKRFLFEP